MRNNPPIQIFEYGFLKIGEQGFDRPHWMALDKYNETHGGGFFSLHHNGVKFNQYVGVIQVGNITVEILPKIGKTAPKGEEAKWQKVLIDMLRECSWMQVYAHEKASLRFKYNSILEAYLELYIIECEKLLRLGLIKKYRLENSNCTALKGKLLFAQNIQKNLVHQELFYTRHQVYDRENIYNQILLKALKLIPVISQSPFLKDRVYSLLLAFPELQDIKVNEATFQRLVFDRKTTPYREAIEIAAMLLLNYRPDISSGHNHVLAILFDMNDLWEEYIYRQLVKHKPADWHIRPQHYKRFWESGASSHYKGVKPDVVITYEKRCVIVDTKWKLPDRNIPDDADLKQMFLYNEYWDGINALLLYPHLDYTPTPKYEPGVFVNRTHSCGVMKTSVLCDTATTTTVTLDRNIGQRLNEYIKTEIFK